MSGPNEVSCLICLRPASSGEHHATCLRRLYGSDTPPRIDLTEATVPTVALATAGQSVMSGVQPKISVGLVRDRRKTLHVDAGSRGRYILKPQTREFTFLPENEHLTMQIARLFGILVPNNGLIRLADGSLAYIVERFDRQPDGSKLRQEDFCQLAGLPPSRKYEATSVDCAGIITRYSARARADLVRLFERVVFAYWVGDGDMHLKNLSLLAGSDGRHSLSPAYDIVCVAIYKEYSSKLVLQLSAEDTRPTLDAWRRFAEVCQLPAPAAEAILRRPAERLAAATELVERSYLPTTPTGLRLDYLACLRSRADMLVTR